jgi:hypothetical protein
MKSVSQMSLIGVLKDKTREISKPNVFNKGS